MRRMIKRFFYLLILALAVTSCKDEKKQVDSTDSNEVETVPEEPNNAVFFTLKINAVVEKDDKATLYYLEGEQTDITTENSVEINIIGSELQQEMIFRLNEDILPTKLVLKYGNEEKAQKITFVNAELSYNEQKIEIDAYKFYQFFIPNAFIEYDQENHIATFKEVNGEYNPIFFSRKVLEDKIDYTFY